MHADAEVVTLAVSRGTLKNFCYLLIDPHTRAAALVDPAWQIETIAMEIERRGVNLRAVLVTHAHPDHTDLAASFAERHACPVWASADAFDHLPALRRYAEIADGRTVQLGEVPIRVLATPGHTTGCVSYWVGHNLFTGDCLFAEGCGMCPDVPAAHAMYASLEMLKRAIPPNTRIFPGHSYGIATGQLFSTLLKENLYLQFRSKEAFTAFRLRSGQNLARMFQFS